MLIQCAKSSNRLAVLYSEYVYNCSEILDDILIMIVVPATFKIIATGHFSHSSSFYSIH